MTSVYRVKAVWNGFQGAPGYSNFSFQGLGTDTANNAAGAAVRAFFEGIKVYLKTTWTVAVQPEILELDMATGTLLGAQTMTTTPAPTTGSSGNSVFTGGSGFVVSWGTSLIFNGHRVRGRTFIVPAISFNESDGTLDPSVITAATAAGNALIAATGADFSIWAKQYDRTVDPPKQIGGAITSVNSVTVKDVSSQLRSRRT